MMKYGFMVFLTDVYPLMVSVLALFYGIKVILRMAKNKPVVLVITGKKIFIFCLLALSLVLVYAHLQCRWICSGFENSASLEVAWAIYEGAVWILVAWFLRTLSRQV